MTTTSTTSKLSPAFQRRLEEHRAEVARLRAEIGDPEEALARWVQEHFSEEALRETWREYEENGYSFEQRGDIDKSNG